MENISLLHLAALIYQALTVRFNGSIKMNSDRLRTNYVKFFVLIAFTITVEYLSAESVSQNKEHDEHKYVFPT